MFKKLYHKTGITNCFCFVVVTDIRLAISTSLGNFKCAYDFGLTLQLILVITFTFMFKTSSLSGGVEFIFKKLVMDENKL